MVVKLFLTCILAVAVLAQGAVPLTPNGITSSNPTREDYLADLAAIRLSTSPPSPPRAPAASNNTNTGPVLTYTVAQISRIVTVDVLYATMNDTLRALATMPNTTSDSEVSTASISSAVSPSSRVLQIMDEDEEIEAALSPASSPPPSDIAEVAATKSPPPPSWQPASPPPPPTSYTPLAPTTVPQLPAGLIKRPKMLAELTEGCPATHSAKLYGAVGDGVTDDSAALVATAKGQRYVYLPPGVYRVAKSISLSRSVIAGVGTSITVDAGVTLTIQGQPYRPAITGDVFFSGAGKVVFTGNLEVYPDWFLNSGEADYNGLQRAGDSCSVACTVILHRIFYLSKAGSWTQWYVNRMNGVFGTQISMVVAQNSYGKGVMFRPGSYVRPFVVPSGGVKNLNIQVGSLSYCQQGVLFDPTSSTTKKIENVVVGHVSAAQSNQHTVVFTAGATTDTFSNCVVRMNFVLTSGLEATSTAASGLGFFDVPGTMSGTSVAFQAYDPAQFLVTTQASALANFASAAISNVKFSVDTWLGGVVTPGNMITGNFKSLNAMLNVAGGMDPAAFFDMTADSASSVSIGTVGSAGVAVEFNTLPTQLSTFNSGDALVQNLDFLSLYVTTDWAAGTMRTYYYYSEFAATGVTGARMSCVYGRWANPGVVCIGFSSLNSSTSNLLAVQLRNAGSATIKGSTNTRIIIGVQTGP